MCHYLLDQPPVNGHLHCFPPFGVLEPAAVRASMCPMYAGPSAGKVPGSAFPRSPCQHTKPPMTTSALWAVSTLFLKGTLGDCGQNSTFSNLAALFPVTFPSEPLTRVPHQMVWPLDLRSLGTCHLHHGWGLCLGCQSVQSDGSFSVLQALGISGRGRKLGLQTSTVQASCQMLLSTFLCHPSSPVVTSF